jgi:hypothetical protein
VEATDRFEEEWLHGVVALAAELVPVADRHNLIIRACDVISAGKEREREREGGVSN